MITRILIAFTIASCLMYPARKELAEHVTCDDRLVAGAVLNPEDL
jgi:hypothetical protein